MGSTAACCLRQEKDGLDPVLEQHPACCSRRERLDSEDSLLDIARSTSSTLPADPEEYLRFFECAETEDELQSLLRREERRAMLDQAPGKALGQRGTGSSSPCSASSRNRSGSPTGRSGSRRWNSPEMVSARILERTREAWKVRVLTAAGRHAEIDICGFDLGSLKIEVDKPGLSAVLARQILREGCPEIDEWATVDVAKRMLRATAGDEAMATQMLLSAVGLRVRDRRLIRSMQCKIACDARVIAKDSEGRPTVWMSAKSQSEPLKEIRDQLVLAFEACCQMQNEEETVNIIADMVGFNGRLNLDVFTLKELSDTLGTVYADKIHKIVVVDFSRAAQMVWMTIKPLMSARTQQKFAFVNGSEARRLLQQFYDAEDYKRIASSFDVNRDKTKTWEDCMMHAKRTKVGDVPLASNWSSSMSTGSTASTDGNGRSPDSLSNSSD
mmetsp:Transcript_128959/g.223750  ORF Transcript_128959/g.223750 Transcript_128959/m.223750 type:complete len:442 (-) Transcript_128959:96-1421(-)